MQKAQQRGGSNIPQFLSLFTPSFKLRLGNALGREALRPRRVCPRAGRVRCRFRGFSSEPSGVGAGGGPGKGRASFVLVLVLDPESLRSELAPRLGGHQSPTPEGSEDLLRRLWNIKG
jgi:hypothetical protein